jgi:hypothetical protein
MDWRIFFIGPMRAGDATSEPTSESAPDSEQRLHYESGLRLGMVKAVEAALSDAGHQPAGEGEHWLTDGTAVQSRPAWTRQSDSDRVTLLQPEGLFSPASIPANVFDAIDDADLVVADLSKQRPAVVYALALAQARSPTFYGAPRPDISAVSRLAREGGGQMVEHLLELARARGISAVRIDPST